MSSHQDLEKLFVSPTNGGAVIHSDASDDEIQILQALNDHFGDNSYKLAISDDADADMTGLNEREMMFLVSAWERVRSSKRDLLLTFTVAGDFHAVCQLSNAAPYFTDPCTATSKVRAALFSSMT